MKLWENDKCWGDLRNHPEFKAAFEEKRKRIGPVYGQLFYFRGGNYEMGFGVIISPRSPSLLLPNNIESCNFNQAYISIHPQPQDPRAEGPKDRYLTASIRFIISRESTKPTILAERISLPELSIKITVGIH